MSDFTITHQIPHPWFHADAWEQHIQPLCVSMPDDGGCVAVLLQVDPMSRNFTLASVVALTVNERKAVRSAIERCRKRRNKSA